MIRNAVLSVRKFYADNPRLFRIWPLPFVVKLLSSIQDVRIKRDKQYKNREALRTIFQTILDTPPLVCNPGAATEMHTVTAHHHLFMYITAVKSFLRFYHDVAVVVHDDGSLRPDDIAALKNHIHGITIIGKKTADEQMNDALVNFPHCRKFRNHVVNSIELFDNILLAKNDKIINLNSDVLFFTEPAEMISWIQNEQTLLQGLYEAQPACQKEFLAEHGCDLQPTVTTAIACFYRHIYDLPFVEQILAGLGQEWFSGQQVWFTAQNIYPLLYHRVVNNHALRYFDKEQYQGSGTFPKNPVFRHYWTSTGMFTDLQCEDSRRVIGELANIK